MEECPVDSKIAQRMACILTYGGENKDIWINYTTFCFVLLICILRARDTLLDDIVVPQYNSLTRTKWLVMGALSLVGVALFQVGLCCFLGCAGISIIWCAMAGWVINERKYHEQPADTGRPTVNRNTLDRLEDVVLTAVLGVLIYYAVTTAFITTVAHFCALTLGTLLSRINRRLILGNAYNNNHNSDAYESMVADPEEEEERTAPSTPMA